jgi:TRAP-type C4-dicarboxylate transport system permease small subunit
MSFRKKLNDPKVLMMIGMVALALANVIRYAFRSAASDEIPDFVFGIFYGIGIPTLLLSVWRRGRSAG